MKCGCPQTHTHTHSVRFNFICQFDETRLTRCLTMMWVGEWVYWIHWQVKSLLACYSKLFVLNYVTVRGERGCSSRQNPLGVELKAFQLNLQIIKVNIGRRARLTWHQMWDASLSSCPCVCACACYAENYHFPLAFVRTFNGFSGRKREWVCMCSTPCDLLRSNARKLKVFTLVSVPPLSEHRSNRAHCKQVCVPWVI